MKRLAASMLVGSACVLLAQDSADLPTFEVASDHHRTLVMGRQAAVPEQRQVKLGDL